MQGDDENSARTYVRSCFGDRLQAIFTGGAPISPDVAEFVRRCFPDLVLHDSCALKDVQGACL